MPHLRIWLLAWALGTANGVDHAKFRTCSQTGFCRRHRAVDTPHPYLVAPNSLSLSSWSGDVSGKLHGGPFGVSLNLQLIAYSSGVARMRITESTPLHGPRWEPQDILESSLKTAPLRAMTAAALGESHSLYAAVTANEATAYAFTTEGTSEAVIGIFHQPFKAALYVGTAPAVTINPTGKVGEGPLSTRPQPPHRHKTPRHVTLVLAPTPPMLLHLIFCRGSILTGAHSLSPPTVLFRAPPQARRRLEADRRTDGRRARRQDDRRLR